MFRLWRNQTFRSLERRSLKIWILVIKKYQLDINQEFSISGCYVASCTARHITFGLSILCKRRAFSQAPVEAISAANEVCLLFGFEATFRTKGVGRSGRNQFCSLKTGPGIFSQMQGAMRTSKRAWLNHVTAASEHCNAAVAEKTKPERLFGVIWSSE